MYDANFSVMYSFCLVAKYGFLGYSQDETPMGTKTKNFGLDLDTDELSFGFHYIF